MLEMDDGSTMMDRRAFFSAGAGIVAASGAISNPTVAIERLPAGLQVTSLNGKEWQVCDPSRRITAAAEVPGRTDCVAKKLLKSFEQVNFVVPAPQGDARMVPIATYLFLNLKAYIFQPRLVKYRVEMVGEFKFEQHHDAQFIACIKLFLWLIVAAAPEPEQIKMAVPRILDILPQRLRLYARRNIIRWNPICAFGKK